MASWTIFESDAVLSALFVETRKVTVRVVLTVDTSELSSSLQLTFTQVWFGYRHLLLQLSCPCRQASSPSVIRSLYLRRRQRS
eukprot:1159664-Pelagomonas_calceolata.AAC.12